MVGSIYVARTMKAAGAVFGGEGNGGLIFPEFQYCRDGGMSAANMLEMLAHTGKKLTDHSGRDARLPQRQGEDQV